ncbi:CAAX amino terminal protease self- immunity [Rubripirellula amarantea]|uniref:CAAX amino terminal protease self-immunity n=2 Tax=Rubripirellula amarantea TaxID=2527999 RepID=A0A5C5WQ90_9BACT|nr:CAAX amino terminal protease self- immunity [Rubripirellula amarantea]
MEFDEHGPTSPKNWRDQERDNPGINDPGMGDPGLGNPGMKGSLGDRSEQVPLPNPYAKPAQADWPQGQDGSSDAKSDVLGNPYLSGSSAFLSRRRLWTPFAMGVVALMVFFVSSLVMALAAVLVVHGTISMELLRDPEQLMSVSRSRLGLLIMVVLPQFALVTPAVIAAFLSPTPMLRRLSLVRGHWPLWAWLAAALATPLVGLASSLVVGLFMDESESLKEMSSIFRAHGASGFLIPLALMIGATPAICEEILFRGYIQTRLTAALHPVIGILIASFLFAVFHLDLVHVVAVFPMGVFLGFVSWRSGSLVPAMLGHFVNNVISVIAVVLAPEGETDVLGAPALMISLGIILAGIMGMAATMVAATMYGKPRDPEGPIELSTAPSSTVLNHV